MIKTRAFFCASSKNVQIMKILWQIAETDSSFCFECRKERATEIKVSTEDEIRQKMEIVHELQANVQLIPIENSFFANSIFLTETDRWLWIFVN